MSQTLRSDLLDEDERFEYPRRVSIAVRRGKARRCEKGHEDCALYAGGPCADHIAMELQEEYGG